MNKKIKLLAPAFLALTFSFNLVSCTRSEKKSNYGITEEADKFVIANQPISSQWFPEELLNWKAEDDKDAAFNMGKVPLAKRVDTEKLEAVNATQNKDMNVVAISIMNASTSGNPSQGSSKFASNTFSYWQYIDKLVYWGGSAGEGLIVPPTADVIDSAHKNGVAVLGTIFFPQTAHGGKMEWLNEFLEKDESGNFPMTDKLMEVAKTYNFDGWFINQETETTKEAPLSIEHAALMQEFIKEFKSKANDDLEIMWYDSMTKDGEMDWQNALTDKNDYFLVDGDKNAVADSMFLNFWWTNKKLVEKELLKASNKKAEEVGVNPYDVYAGVDMQENGTGTPIRWDLFENGPGKNYTSLGLYCPSWTYFSSETIEEFENKENRLWVNEFKNPTINTETKGTEWKGISTYAVEKSVVNKLPFNTSFNMGNGYNFFINGEKASERDWNNRSLGDIMPSYRWIIANEGNNKLNATMDFATAFYGGNSIKFMGNLEGSKSSNIKLYSADLKLEKGIEFTTSAKSSAQVDLDLVLEFHDGSTETIKADKAIGTEWTTVKYDVSKLTDKSIKTISYKISSEENVSNLIFNLGNITIQDPKSSKKINVKNLKLDDAKFEEEDMYAGSRLSWDSGDEKDIDHYEVYRINDDKTSSFLGATQNNRFFVNALKRDDKSDKTTFEVVAVNKNNKSGKSDKVVMEWPANNIPKANLKVSKTLVAPGEEITFESISSAVTESVEWSMPGSSTEKSTDNNPKVSYAKDGVYSVTLTAKNKEGEDVKVIEDFITVSSKVKSELTNLSQNKQVTASSFVNPAEAPNFALDGKTNTKWCATGTAPHDITIDLGAVKTVSEIRMAHAEAGGENPGMNTQSYTIETSLDGVTFTPVVEVLKNQLGNTVDTFKATQAKYVKINVLKPSQGADSAVRIYEIDVLGIDSIL
ncbi:discoidin domain-containing protein [Clostridium gasigenes]|uniref:endo-beta-N-acetylglucosaminidase n=1 Tax=Clostridium gasigenes TaxID=94869 RepID=UPI001438344D|nr:discoidin domain-containing protein [Clostridium gasigenes]NKF06455.1 PKD domain-containing protein [Clostridium gasigenes]QSW21183.1 discoidin domain-containing protein [Clostridium gasigenes]